jgi:hypothetical protein
MCSLLIVYTHIVLINMALPLRISWLCILFVNEMDGAVSICRPLALELNLNRGSSGPIICDQSILTDIMTMIVGSITAEFYRICSLLMNQFTFTELDGRRNDLVTRPVLCGQQIMIRINYNDLLFICDKHQDFQ